MDNSKEETPIQEGQSFFEVNDDFNNVVDLPIKKDD